MNFVSVFLSFSTVSPAFAQGQLGVIRPSTFVSDLQAGDEVELLASRRDIPIGRPWPVSENRSTMLYPPVTGYVRSSDGSSECVLSAYSPRSIGAGQRFQIYSTRSPAESEYSSEVEIRLVPRGMLLAPLSEYFDNMVQLNCTASNSAGPIAAREVRVAHILAAFDHQIRITPMPMTGPFFGY